MCDLIKWGWVGGGVKAQWTFILVKVYFKRWSHSEWGILWGCKHGDGLSYSVEQGRAYRDSLWGCSACVRLCPPQTHPECGGAAGSITSPSSPTLHHSSVLVYQLSLKSNLSLSWLQNGGSPLTSEQLEPYPSTASRWRLIGSDWILAPDLFVRSNIQLRLFSISSFYNLALKSVCLFDTFYGLKGFLHFLVYALKVECTLVYNNVSNCMEAWKIWMRFFF